MWKSVHTPQYRSLLERLRAIRHESRRSQREVAAALSVPPSWVSKVESGERRLDFVEFYWFCLACGAEPVAEARQVIQRFGQAPASAKRGGNR